MLSTLKSPTSVIDLSSSWFRLEKSVSMSTVCAFTLASSSILPSTSGAMVAPIGDGNFRVSWWKKTALGILFPSLDHPKFGSAPILLLKRLDRLLFPGRTRSLLDSPSSNVPPSASLSLTGCFFPKNLLPGPLYLSVSIISNHIPALLQGQIWRETQPSALVASLLDMQESNANGLSDVARAWTGVI